MQKADPSMEGLIYRHYRPVHYSPSSRSALAEAELVYKDDHVSHSVYVSFELDRKVEIKSSVLKEFVASSASIQLLVWTTTPWTLTANMVRPRDTWVNQEFNFLPGNCCSQRSDILGSPPQKSRRIWISHCHSRQRSNGSAC